MRWIGVTVAIALATPAAVIAKVTDLQCVPFARNETGIQIYGDAWTWWGQAEGRYRRGSRPVAGAVMAFRPYGNSKLGHVAVVAKIVNNREVLLNHSNWSLINGRRGQIERGVRAIDVSEDNDWSRVRVWYAPIGDLGTTHFPLFGFIYPDGVKMPKSKQEKKDEAKAIKTPKDKRHDKTESGAKALKPAKSEKPEKTKKPEKSGKATGLPGIAKFLGR